MTGAQAEPGRGTQFEWRNWLQTGIHTAQKAVYERRRVPGGVGRKGAEIEQNKVFRCGTPFALPGSREAVVFRMIETGPGGLRREEECVKGFWLSAALGASVLVAGCGSNTDVGSIEITPA